MIDIDFSQYKDVNDLINKTRKTPEELIKIIDTEITKLLQDKK